jgi:hypothetical protein
LTKLPPKRTTKKFKIDDDASINVEPIGAIKIGDKRKKPPTLVENLTQPTVRKAKKLADGSVLEV